MPGVTNEWEHVESNVTGARENCKDQAPLAALKRNC